MYNFNKTATIPADRKAKPILISNTPQTLSVTVMVELQDFLNLPRISSLVASIPLCAGAFLGLTRLLNKVLAQEASASEEGLSVSPLSTQTEKEALSHNV